MAVKEFFLFSLLLLLASVTRAKACHYNDECAVSEKCCKNVEANDSDAGECALTCSEGKKDAPRPACTSNDDCEFDCCCKQTGSTGGKCYDYGNCPTGEECPSEEDSEECLFIDNCAWLEKCCKIKGASPAEKGKCKQACDVTEDNYERPDCYYDDTCKQKVGENYCCCTEGAGDSGECHENGCSGSSKCTPRPTCKSQENCDEDEECCSELGKTEGYCYEDNCKTGTFSTCSSNDNCSPGRCCCEKSGTDILGICVAWNSIPVAECNCISVKGLINNATILNQHLN